MCSLCRESLGYFTRSQEVMSSHRNSVYNALSLCKTYYYTYVHIHVGNHTQYGT